jgi:hypothetical protein
MSVLQIQEITAAASSRRSGRIGIHISIELMGVDGSGEEFLEKATTIAVSRHGAAVVTLRTLAPEQQVYVRRFSGKIEAAFRVVGQVGTHDGENIYGLSRENAASDVWGITFPDSADSIDLLASVLLQCQACGSREVMGLTEIELDVFRTNHRLVRSCARCFQQTDWVAVPEANYDGAHRSSAGDSAGQPKAPNRRRHKRIAMQVTACIRRSGTAKEVVTTADVSKGGMRFLSNLDYELSSWVEVAVPFVPESANIFTAARIVRVQESKKKKGYKEYGIEYVQK